NTLLGIETTDATGKATHAMPAGGSVTAYFDRHNFVTILGAEPGDTLTPLAPAWPSFNLFLAITPPAGAPPANTSSYRVAMGGCTTEAFATTTDPVYLSCSDEPDPRPLVLTAMDSNGAVVGTTVTGSVGLAMDTTNVTFAGPWSTAP